MVDISELMWRVAIWPPYGHFRKDEKEANGQIETEEIISCIDRKEDNARRKII